MSELVDGPPEGAYSRAMMKLGTSLGGGLWEQAATETLIGQLFPDQERSWEEEFRAGALVIATHAILTRSCMVITRGGTDLHRSIDPVPAAWDRWFELVAGAIKRENERFAKVENWRIERQRAAMLARRGVVEMAGKSPREEMERLQGLIQGNRCPYLPEEIAKRGASFVAYRGSLRFLDTDNDTAARQHREAALSNLAAEVRGAAREALNKALDSITVSA